MRYILGIFGLCLSLGLRAESVSFDAEVAVDGSKPFKTVQAAVDDYIKKGPAPGGRVWRIHLNPGIYREQVRIPAEAGRLTLMGDSAAQTTIAFALSAAQRKADGTFVGTFNSCTFFVGSSQATFEGITFQNDTTEKAQAVAVRVDGDRIAFRHCRFLGRQDTLLVNQGRHYFDHCEITGAVDFIFGGATAYFDHCRIVVTDIGYITAPSTPANSPWGLVFVGCDVSAAQDKAKAYLGRPWRDYGATAFIDCQLGACVRPEGWHDWRVPERQQTSRFMEVGCMGPGAVMAQRVAWIKPLDAAEAKRWTPAHVLGGADHWVPEGAFKDR
jgi:pectinesterase